MVTNNDQITTIRSILLLGAARSGSSWTSRMLCSNGNVYYINEPDSHFLHACAAKARDRAGIFPHIHELNHKKYAQYWKNVFGIGQLEKQTISSRVSNRLWSIVPGVWKDNAVSVHDRSTAGKLTSCIASLSQVKRPDIRSHHQFVLAKTVHAPFCATSIVDAVSPDSVIVMVRPVEDIAASWIVLGYWPLRQEQYGHALETLNLNYKLANTFWPVDNVKSIVWTIAAMQTELVKQAKIHGWYLFDHNEACQSPVMAFKQLFDYVGLDWTVDASRSLKQSNTSGSGYETHRVLNEEAGKWKRRLCKEDQIKLIEALEELGIVC